MAKNSMNRAERLITGRIATSAAILAVAMTCPLALFGFQNPTASTDVASEIVAFAQNYCVECHAGAKPSAGLSFSNLFASKNFEKSREIWELVADRVREREMPPPKNRQPADDDRARLVQAIDARLKTGAAPSLSVRKSGIRRLNRAEYDNTIRDLFGMDLKPADSFPLDDVGHGFDNIGDVLAITPLLMEKYLNSADYVLSSIFAREGGIKSTVRLFNAGEFQNSSKNSKLLPVFDGRLLSQRGEMTRRFRFENDGEYRFRIRARAMPSDDQPCKLTFRIDGRDIKSFEVVAPQNGKRARAGDSVVETIHAVKAGVGQISLEFMNPSDLLKSDDSATQIRRINIINLEISGPINPPPPEPSVGYRRIFLERRPAESDEEYGKRIIEAFAGRAFRRSVSPKDVDRFWAIANLAHKQGDSFEAGIRVAIKAILVSPHFLFHVNGDEFALASRLSYFLWSSMPDDELLAQAKAGKLSNPQLLDQQVMRMLADTKSRALADNFAGQWLQTRNLQSLAIDSKTFPRFDENLRSAMIEETMRFFDAVVREDRSILELVKADYSFVNERLAKHYGISGIHGGEFRRVTMPSDRRGGILTQAGFLTTTSNPTRTSPVKRGKFILENLLGATVPPPPPDIPELDASGHELKGTLRQRMEQHRANPNCATCHDRMDPLGFVLENFDGVGQFRSRDAGFPIDPSSTLPDGRKLTSALDLCRIVSENTDAFRKCLAEKLFTYALGRGLDRNDRKSLNVICASCAEGGDRFASLVRAIVKSDQFQCRLPDRKER